MLEVVSWTLIPFITYIVDCYIYGKLINKNCEFNVKNIVLIVIAAIINCYCRYNYVSSICTIASNLELIILLKLIFDKSITKTLIATLFIFIGYAISEVLFASTFTLVLNLDLTLVETLPFSFISNIFIILIMLLIGTRKLVIKTVKNIMNWYKDNDLINSIILIIIAFATFCIVTYPISAKTNSRIETIVYIIFFLFVAVFVSGFFKQKSKNNELNSEYDHLLEYIKVYEKEVNEKSKRQHEYKNQLIIINDMLKGKNKKVSKYISEILEGNFLENNKNLLNELKYIPDGGLKGLIYFKLSNLKYEECEVHVFVDKVLENKKMWKTCLDNLSDVSKIIGVFLDNAIEAISEEKNKYIIIDVEYENNCLIFKFSNTCTKHIDSAKLDIEGYSTKGKKHGYGLSLVKDIIDNNNLLNNKREQNGQLFVQYLYINKKSR